MAKKKVKNNKKSKNRKTDVKVNKKLSSREIKIIQSTQSLLPIKEVRDGIIITEDKRYIKVIEFTPTSYFLKSPMERMGIIESYSRIFKSKLVKMQIKTYARKANMDEYLNKLKKEKNEEQNQSCNVLQDEYIKFVSQIGAQEGVSRRFFFIFEFVNDIRGKSPTFNEIKGKLLFSADSITAYMRQCGNEVIESNDPTTDVMEMLYELLNRKKCEEISFEENANEIIEKYKNDNGFDNDSLLSIPTSEFIAPSWIDFNEKDCVKIDRRCYKYLYITSHGYKTAVSEGWMSEIINMGEGVDVDMFFWKQPKEAMLRTLSQKVRMNRASMNDTESTSTTADKLENATESALFIKNALINNDEDFYYMNTFITVSGDTYKETTEKIDAIKDYLMAQDIKCSECKYQQEQAFITMLPLCNVDKGLFKKSKRNITTNSVAGSYQFISSELCDSDGVMMGVAAQNNSLVILDIFDTSKYKNANMTILGTSGAGKTFTMCLLAERLRLKGIQVYIIAPEKGHEFKRLCNQLGGQYIKISAGSRDIINMLEIRKKADKSNDILDDDEDETQQDSILQDKIQQLLIFFSLVITDISLSERQLLDNVLLQVYQQKGITDDNLSLLSNPNDPDSKYRLMPTMTDVYRNLMTIKSTERMGNIIKPYVDGSAKSFNGQTNVSLENNFIVLDMSSLHGEMKTVGMFVILDYVWQKIREDRIHKKAVFIDEVWQLIGASSTEGAADYVLKLFKLIRGYGGSAIAATQDVGDFFALADGKYGKAIINNAKLKIVLGLEDEEARSVQKVLKLTDSEVMTITKMERGQGLIAVNNNNIFVQFKASEMEVDLITTDRGKLAEIAMRKEEEAESLKKTLTNAADNIETLL